MRIIKPSATLLLHNKNNNPYKFIEMIGRIWYKSEDKIEEGSAENFVKNLITHKHWAMLEHETLYFVVSEEFMGELFDDTKDLDALKFFNVSYDGENYIISGSFRSFHDLFERDLFSYPIRNIKSILQYKYPLVFGEYEEFDMYEDTDCILLTRQMFIEMFKYEPKILSHHLTHTFLFVCDRGVSHELIRHRVASFAWESICYCNYGPVKEDEITVIEPCFWESGEHSDYFYEWYRSCHQAEVSYLNFLRWGASPQQARTVLPNSLKTELVITATEEEWQHIVNLRYIGTTGAPHPQMKEVMGHAIEALYDESEGRVTYYEAD